MALGDADLRIFYRSLGDPVAFEGVSTYLDGEPVKGFVEDLGQDAEFDQVKVSDVRYRLELPCDAFNPMPRSRSQVQVMSGRLAGSYTIHSSNPIDDGARVELRMRRV